MISQEAALPSVGFIIATLDEEHHIEACVQSVLAQDYPSELLQVAVVDGGSTDGTLRIVDAIAASDDRVVLVHNPKRIAASAFNLGARALTSDLISLVSAHSVLSSGYARTLVDAFASSGASLVGGRMRSVVRPGGGPTAEAIARATSSPFGLGSARFHYDDEPGWVDTAFPGAYRRQLFDEIGYFDESLVRNQDDELHLRARLAGHPMWFEPALITDYFPRTTFARLWRQYFEYGWWRAATVRKHGRVASWRHLAPPVFVAGAVGGATLARQRLACRFWIAGMLAWLGIVGVGAAREPGGVGLKARVGVAIGLLHVAYGCGFWVGLARGGRGG